MNSNCGSNICSVNFYLIFDVIDLLVFYFFFSSRRRHTRFDCDWSSDVCSSDLLPPPKVSPFWRLEVGSWPCHSLDPASLRRPASVVRDGRDVADRLHVDADRLRSEERRVGKECRSRRWPEQ